MTMSDVNPRSILPDADGPWLPLTPELRAELTRRLATLELTPDTQAKARLRRPTVARQVRTGIVAWLEEKSAGAGTDWSAPTMWRYRAILRELGPPEGGSSRQAGYAHLGFAGALAGAGAVGAAAATAPSLGAAVALALLDITLIISACARHA